MGSTGSDTNVSLPTPLATGHSHLRHSGDPGRSAGPLARGRSQTGEIPASQWMSRCRAVSHLHELLTDFDAVIQVANQKIGTLSMAQVGLDDHPDPAAFGTRCNDKNSSKAQIVNAVAEIELLADRAGQTQLHFIETAISYLAEQTAFSDHCRQTARNIFSHERVDSDARNAISPSALVIEEIITLIALVEHDTSVLAKTAGEAVMLALNS